MNSRNKVLLFLVGILLLTNIVLVIFFVGKKDKPDHNNGPRPSRAAVMKGYLKDSVGFDEQQLARYEDVRDRHDENMKSLFEQMRNAKLEFYKLINNPGATDSASSAAAAAIGQKQQAVDLAFFNHFREVRMLCRPDQQPKYDSLVQRIVRKMVWPQKRGDSRDKKESKILKK
ncbi:MAG: hypothetical protein WCF67_01290 [Chitinophagaceae bacterium]